MDENKEMLLEKLSILWKTEGTCDDLDALVCVKRASLKSREIKQSS